MLVTGAAIEEAFYPKHMLKRNQKTIETKFRKKCYVIEDELNGFGMKKCSKLRMIAQDANEAEKNIYICI